MNEPEKSEVEVNVSRGSGLGCFMILVGIAVLLNFSRILDLIKAAIDR